MKVPVFLLLLTLFSFSTTLVAQEPVNAAKLNSEIIFEWYPDSEEWYGISSLKTFMHQPDPKGVPSEKTEIMLAYTDDYLWVDGRFNDKPESLLNRFRDGLFHQALN